MIILFSVLAIAGLVVAILLFGDSPNYRNTIVHRLHLLLARTNAKVAAFVGGSPRLYAALRWLVPCFYCVVMGFCILKFFADIYPQLPNEILHSYLHNGSIGAIIATVMVATALVTFSDPGTVTAANVDAACARFHGNNLIFFPKRCSTCRLPKPARSKHCSVCNRCFMLYDHHCIWINNCIGLRNYRWFILFLISNITIMAYGGWLCWVALKTQPHPFGYWRLIVGSSEANKTAGTLAILCVIFVPITSLFTGLHVRYLYLGVTTNEAEKWGEIEHLVSLGVLYFVEETQQYVEQATIKQNGRFCTVYLLLSDETVLFDASAEYTLVKVELVVTDLDNVYDLGFVQNCKERLWI